MKSFTVATYIRNKTMPLNYRQNHNITVGRHIFKDKDFEDFMDIYRTLKIFILKFFAKLVARITAAGYDCMYV